ncbi:beta-galactosidase, partial [Bacteroides ovatus]
VTKIPEGLLHLMHNRLYEITPVKAVTLIADSQNGSKNTRLVGMNGQELKMTSLPFECPPRSTVVSEATFKVDKDFNHLSLWLNVAGEAKVWLNGVEVFVQEAKQTRQYNQYNISDYSRYLRKGSNLLKIEVKDSKKMRFDYGLRAY